MEALLGGVPGVLTSETRDDRSRSPRRVDAQWATLDGAGLALLGTGVPVGEQPSPPTAGQWDATIAGGLSPAAAALIEGSSGLGNNAVVISPSLGATSQVIMQLPSTKLGQLLGFKGSTTQKVKEITGVTRLHIMDKDRAKFQATVPVEVAGTPEQVAHCHRLLEAIVAGDQTELGHIIMHVPVDPALVGKVMGAKGQTVKEMTQVTGAYIEIQQDVAQGATAGPRLFIAGLPEQVHSAVDLVARFLESPGSRLEAVMGPGAWQPPMSQQQVLHQLQQPQQLHTLGTPVLPELLPQPELQQRALSLPEILAALPLEAIEAYEGLVRVFGPGASKNALTSHARPPGPAVVGDGGRVEERRIQVPARVKGHLLGLRGSTIELVRQTSSVVKCHLEEGKGVGKGGFLDVTIVGTRECNQHCVDLIDGIVRGDHSGLGHVTTYIQIDRSVIGKIMGYKGQTVKELTEVTGCYIEIQQEREQGAIEGPRLFVAGPPESVSSAVQLIQAFVASPASRLEAVLGPDLKLPRQSGNASATLAALASSGHGPTGLGNALSLLSGLPGLEVLADIAAQEAPAVQVISSPPPPLLPATSLPATSLGALPGALPAALPTVVLPAVLPAETLGAAPRDRPPLMNPSMLRSSVPAPSHQVVVPPRQVVQVPSVGLGGLPGLSDIGIGGAAAVATVAGARPVNGGVLEQKIVEIPASKKGHLLGLRGQTIEKVRSISGVKKCHLDEERGFDHRTNVKVQIVGTPDQTNHCASLIARIVAGDHSGIGHATDYLEIPVNKVNRLMGHRGEVVTQLKDMTQVYLDIQQGPQPGVPAGQARVFIAGPPENISQARHLVNSFLKVLDQHPDTDE